MAIITALVAGWILFSVIPRINKVFVADENDLHGSGFGNDIIEYDDIKSIDWKLWDKKGIVKLILENNTSCTLDSWHFKGIKGVVETIVEKRPDLGQSSGNRDQEPGERQGLSQE